MLASFACCVVPGVALAQPTSSHSLSEAQLLLESCQSDAPTLRAMCLGYLAAISDEVRRGLAAGTIVDPVCPPAVVSLEAYRQAYIGFLAARPGQLHGRPAAETVRASYLAAWACR